MANSSFPRRLRAGPRTLVVATAVAIMLGAATMYLYANDGVSLLYFFYLPVTAASVVLGKRTGVFLAGFAVIAAIAPSVVGGLDQLVSGPAPRTAKIAMIVTWAVFLFALAWLVGLVSESGGSLSLTQRLGDKAIRAIERERRRTGQDIHDGIAQYAAAALMESAILDDLAVNAEPRVRLQIDRVTRSLDSLVTEARAMVGNLRPPAFGPTEFPSTVSLLVDAFRLRTGVSCELELEGDFAIHSDSMRICVYRVTQEALANVERHAEATSVRVWARASRGSVSLVVQDDGKGFEYNDCGYGNGNGHFGLLGMRERVAYLGGKLTVRSAPSGGTTLAIYVPSYRGEGSARSGSSRAH